MNPDNSEPARLLSGGEGVTAQTARARLEAERDRAMARIAELDRDFAGIVASAADGTSGGDDEHDPEGATLAYERQYVAALQARARASLTDIGVALRKLDDGRYGECDRCGQPIGDARLAARPAALVCVRCAARR
jgi:RNA polymerase-binding transcription factor DksA